MALLIAKCQRSATKIQQCCESNCERLAMLLLNRSKMFQNQSHNRYLTIIIL